MSPSRIFILRPVATTLLMAAILIVGLVAYKFLPLSALPEVDYPTIQVQTFYPGASPDVMTSSVTAPLERQLGQMPGLKQMSSTSSSGASVITLQFTLSLNLDVAEQEVQAAINAAGNLLPADLPAPPVYAKVNPADAPVLTLALTSVSMPLTRVEDLADTRLAQKISQLPGVGLVSIGGGQRQSMRIRVNPRTLAAYGLNIDDLRSTVSNGNVNTAKGNFDGPSRSYAINANDQLKTPEEYKKLVIAYRNGAPVRLSDVATVADAPENTKLGAWFSRTPAIILNIQRQPGANVIDVVESIRSLLPGLQASLPPDITVSVLTDRTVTIRASVHDVEMELTLAVILVVAVIFVFLRNIPATIIPSLSVPLSLIGTFAVMYLLGFSLNNLSLMSLTIAAGFVVDDAIVMIENIARYVEKGESPLAAALKGSEQIGFTIISLTISLIAVLIPLLFMGDVVGRLFREFAITLAVTILISAVVSLTLVPMMCAKLVKHRPEADEPAWSRKAAGWFDAMIARYAKMLDWVLAHQPLTLMVAVGTLVLTIILYIFIPKGFFPEQDTGLIQVITEAKQSASYGAMAGLQQQLADTILKDPDVESLSSFIGVDGTNTTLNTGRMLLNLKPREDRKSNAAEIIGRLQHATAAIPGATAYMQPVQDLTIDDRVSRTQYQFVLESADPAVLADWTARLAQRLQDYPQLSDVASDLAQQGLAAYVIVDRDTAARFGITAATVDNALYDAFGQRIISTIFTESNQYRVIMEASSSMQKSPASLNQIYVPSAGGGQVPLSAIARIEERAAPLLINHLSQFPANTISFNVPKGGSLGEAVKAVRAAEADLGMPASVIISFQGAASSFEASLTNQLFLILAAILTMYIILGVLYESFIHPITILSTLPSAGIGALLALMVVGSDLGVIGIIGIILLIGIVKKNAIMMIDFALDAERNEGLAPREAIYQACLLRFRPILMTTMAALLGAVPLMCGTGMGSELRHPLGITIVGGLIVSQMLTLFTTPVIYLAFERLAARFRKPAPSALPAAAAKVQPVNISEPFIRRPVATTLLTVGIALAGIAAYLQLPVSPLPQVDFPTISVSASMAGANPETMSTSVATPLERHLGAIADVTEMTSQSSVGSTSITLQFGLSRDIDGAARDVQAAINAARADLPAALKSNPTYRKVNPADAPILVLALTSKTMSQGQLYDAAATILQQRLSQVPGVGDVNVGGSSLPAVRVELNPEALFKYGIGLEDVRAALASANANSPKGAIENRDTHWQIYSNDQARTAAQYHSLVVAFRNGAAVRLSDVATVLDSVEDIRNAGISQNEPAVIITISRQPGANIIDTVDRVLALMPALQASIPGAARLAVAVNRSTTIRASLHDVEVTLGISVLLVVFVVFAFLQDPRATLIPSVAVPISLIGTFGAMYLLDYSLDNLSLMALTIATGFVVDDAIVVMENIVRHMENGMPRFEASLLGVREVGFTVLSMSLSLIAVFIPILLMGGIVGRLFREFAVTLSMAILISMVISLTTTPMMCARLLGRPEEKKVTRLGRLHDSLFEDLRNFYGQTLQWALNRGPLMLGVLVVTVGLNVWLFTTIPKGFFPEQDTGRLQGGLQADQSISFQLMQQKLKQMVAIVTADPAVANVVGTTGSGRGGGSNTGNLQIALKPLGERTESSEQVIARLRPQMAQVAGATLYLSPAQEIRAGGRQSNSLYQYTLQADDLSDLRTWTPRLVEALKTEPVLQDVNSDQQDKGLETDLVIDRDTASRLGLTASQVDNTLNDAFAQRQVSTIYESLNQYHVIMVVAPRFWQNPESLKDVYVSTSAASITGSQSTNAVAGTVAVKGAKAVSASASVAADSARNAAQNSIAATGHSSGSTGQAVSTSKEKMVPLAAFAHYQMGTTPLAVNHQSQFAAATVSFNLDPNASLSDAVEAINRQVARIHMPASVHGSFQGTASTYQQSVGNEPILILAALVAIYVVLGILYESYAHPLTILSTLPSAGLGAVLALNLFNTEFSLIALIGVFLLIGIVKKNAIMMIDFAIQAERDEGLSPRDSIFKASLLRFRPIMMTTSAALLGSIPLAIGFGNGAELRRPLGIAIAGGLIVSQLLTLYTTPVVYLYVDRARSAYRRIWHRTGAAPAHGKPAPVT